MFKPELWQSHDEYRTLVTTRYFISHFFLMLYRHRYIIVQQTQIFNA